MSEDTNQIPDEAARAPAVEDQATQDAANEKPAEVTESAPAVEEPKPAPVVEPVKVVAKAVQTAKVTPKAAPTVQATTQGTGGEPTFIDIIAQIKERGTVQQRALITAIENYAEAMKPGKPVDGDAGARIQFGFWKTILTVAESADVAEFKILWNILLGFFHQERAGVFHERYVFRFSEFWVQSEAELTGFQRILNLIKLTADANTRQQSLKQVDLQRMLEVGFTETGRQRILSFYA